MTIRFKAVWLRVGVVVILAAIAGTATSVKVEARRAWRCPQQRVDATYADAVTRAVGEKQDVWGNALLRSPGGPTYEGVQRYLHPLMLVGHPAGKQPRRLTDSGVYYLPFGRPSGPNGAGAVDLHVADGSQIVSETVDGPKLSIDVGAAGGERYGSCLARLGPSGLYSGYLPILETTYADAEGSRYRQESFAARIPQTRSLVSFVRLFVDPRGSRRGAARIRFTPSEADLAAVAGKLRRGRKTRLLFSRGGRFDGSSLVYSTRRGKPRTIYVAWLDQPMRTRPLRLGRASYERARQSVVSYWNRRLSRGAAFVVPETRVLDAERNLLIQNMLLSWRYSLGNPYERFTWELIDVAEVMGDYGFGGIEHAILERSFRSRSYFPNRAAGERMAGSAHFYRRFHDRAYLDNVTPVFRRYLAAFDQQLTKSRSGILVKERYGTDLANRVYGLHDQALALEGLRSMSEAWSLTHHPHLAQTASRLAARLEAGLREAVRSSATELPDGSLFVPIALLDGKEVPFDALTTSKRGSYWNLVMPYVLASGFFVPGSAEAAGVFRYMLNHGSRFLGLVRFAPHTGQGNPGYRAPGSDDVYGTNVVRFLADNDHPDQLVLSLYGKLGADMTPGTFVAGEGSTVGPVTGEYYRSTFRPPNSANNAFFLAALRLMLVHETTGPGGTPRGLELGYATPRAWLRPGRRIVVRRARTSFGVLSYSLEAREQSIRVSLKVPDRAPPKTLKLRLRLPDGERVTGVAVEGRTFHRFDSHVETIDLSGLRGRLDLVVAVSDGNGGGG